MEIQELENHLNELVTKEKLSDKLMRLYMLRAKKGDMTPQDILMDIHSQRDESYEKISEIAQGGFGKIFRVREKKSEQIFAQKQILLNRVENDRFFELYQRFQREIKIMREVSDHPNIPSLHDYIFQPKQNRLAFTMEFIEGNTLCRTIESLSNFYADEEDVSYVTDFFPHLVQGFIEICSAVAYIHKNDIIHRDITPSNIMIAETKKAYLIDFGLARNLENYVQITASGETAGNLQYMPPEQWSNKGLDFTSDVYSLGAVLYTIIQLKSPYPLYGYHEIAEQIRHGRPFPQAKIRMGMSPKFAQIVVKATQYFQEDRYQNIEDMIRDLKTAQEETDRETQEETERIESTEVEKKGFWRKWFSRK